MLLFILSTLFLASCVPLDIAFGPFPYSAIQPVSPPSQTQTTFRVPETGVQEPDIYWHTPWLVAGAAGWMLPFDDDFRGVSGYTLQAGYGHFMGGGLRFMDFSYHQKSTGDRYDARTWLAYLGAGAGMSSNNVKSSGLASYFGGALGTTELTGPGASDDWGFSGGGAYAITTYRNIGPADDPAAVIGLSAEIGLFFSAPGDVNLCGTTGMLGAYIDF